MSSPSAVSSAEDAPRRQAEREERGPFPGPFVGVDAGGVVGDEQREHEDEQLEHLEDPGELLEAVLHDPGRTTATGCTEVTPGSVNSSRSTSSGVAPVAGSR